MQKIQLAVFLFAITVWLPNCQTQSQKSKPLSEEQQELLQDSLEYAASLALQHQIMNSVQADAETNSVASPLVDDDAADDMAVWVNQANPEESLIVGSNKKGGVVVFNLQGKELDFYPTGRINNIDVTYGFQLSNKKIDLVGCTNRTEQSVNLFYIDPRHGKLIPINARPLTVDTSLVKDVYGFCFYHSNKHYLFLNGKNGMVQQFELIATPDEKIDLKLVRQVKFNSQTEGMVADETYKMLYIGEEDQGIWKVAAEPDGENTPVLIAKSGEDNANIRFDIEGLALYKRDTSGYLIASSQGNFSYAVFERKEPNRYVGSFKITDSDMIDGVEETDGIDVIHLPLGASFPQGVFIAQDGFNYEKGTLQRQNFKIVRWEKIEALFQK